MRKGILQPAIICLLLMTSATAVAQTFGPSDPTPKSECGVYQWPEVQSPCPEVQIKQKHDHTAKLEYRQQGWDTAVTCDNYQIVLSCMPYIPTQFFNGQYTVDTIPYNPPDTTFFLAGKGTKMNIKNDDVFAPNSVKLDYPFFFFGFEKKSFRLGDNGLVTFCTDSAYKADVSGSGTDDRCPYSFSNPIPWSAQTTPESGYFNRMHDAIYGIYQDTYTGFDGAYMKGNDGIYYGVLDSFPCRKIIASWNNIPIYNDSSKRETYQIVAYEGSNIIEVHIKKRNGGTSTNNGIGVIGIQNATGKKQVKGDPDTPTQLVVKDSPAAFYPKGRNTYKTSEKETAYRFTPQGRTAVTYNWYRIFDDGSDSIELTTDQNDTNGYYTPMDGTSTCPTLTTATVNPTTVSKYVFHLRFRNANKDMYDLYDTIVIGVDTANTTYLHPKGMPTTTNELSICAGAAGQLQYTIPKMQVPTNMVYSVYRVSMGNKIDIDTSDALEIGELYTELDNKHQNITLKSTLPTEGVMQNKIDSIYINLSVDYISGCTNHGSILVKIYPTFDTTEDKTICKGEKYYWEATGQEYAATTSLTANLKSTPGCDSTAHLNLTVLDVSHTYDHINACKPYTWINGITYENTNSATSSSDTVVLKNSWGCDSIVQLDLKMYPLVAQIQATRNHFTYDNLDVELNDISSNSNSRTWRLPNGITSEESSIKFTMPTNLDSADIWLIARSSYGCVDSAQIVIPFRKETFWVPNIFTPEQQNENNTFRVIGKNILWQKMYIYDRAGRLIFECDGVDCAWDGHDKDGRICPQGTYVYYLIYTNEYEPKRQYTKKGTVTLIR